MREKITKKKDEKKNSTSHISVTKKNNLSINGFVLENRVH